MTGFADELVREIAEANITLLFAIVGLSCQKDMLS